MRHRRTGRAIAPAARELADRDRHPDLRLRRGRLGGARGRLLRAGRVSEGAATVGAFSAAGLLAIDFLHLVQSRMAMLDVFVTLFVVAAVLFTVLDVTRDRGPGARGWGIRLTLGRPWRLLTGVSLGAAGGGKWAGAYAGLPGGALLLPW